MGRYYSGDIDGKLMFGVQNSNAADRFGVIGEQPYYLEYTFDDNELDRIGEELRKILTKLKGKRSAIARLLLNGYTLQDRLDAGVTEDDLSEYADLILGLQIRRCILQNDTCHFIAEL